LGGEEMKYLKVILFITFPIWMFPAMFYHLGKGIWFEIIPDAEESVTNFIQRWKS
jgi:hypothetical protein